jgi:hypothetical protein
MITSSNEFQQVTPFSLFHRASTVQKTKKRQAFSVTLTHRNKSEMAYQVMRNIAENRCTHILIDLWTHRPIDHVKKYDIGFVSKSVEATDKLPTKWGEMRQY